MKTVQRAGPASGYDHGAKRQYRREVWATLARECRVPRAAAQVFLMPSIEGAEIEVALSKGFREQNLHVCDYNAAIAATLKRRFPRITAYGVEAHRALERCPRLDVINLDLCGTVWSAIDAVAAATRKLSGFTGGAVAVTYLRGRDGIGTDGRDGDADRLVALMAGAQRGAQSRGQYISVVRTERYRISASPMGWTVLSASAIPIWQAINSTLRTIVGRAVRPAPALMRDLVALEEFDNLRRALEARSQAGALIQERAENLAELRTLNREIAQIDREAAHLAKLTPAERVVRILRRGGGDAARVERVLLENGVTASEISEIKKKKAA